MPPIPKPPHGDITHKELEEHLEKECGLTIREKEDFYYEEVDYEMINQFPEHEHPSWNAGTAEVWEPEQQQWYEQEHYDRVVVSTYKNKESAKAQLMRLCMEHNLRRVGEMFRSRGKWCVRVREIEV
jgi:hypothetical protein